jgi:hypothetical protein
MHGKDRRENLSAISPHNPEKAIAVTINGETHEFSVYHRDFILLTLLAEHYVNNVVAIELIDD